MVDGTCDNAVLQFKFWKITNNSIYTTNEMIAFINEIVESITELNL